MLFPLTRRYNMNIKKYRNAILAVAHEYYSEATLDKAGNHFKLDMGDFTLSVSATPKVPAMVLKEVRRDIKRYISGHYTIQQR
ncbi:hypothetical protein NVP2275O_153 [Vibrio phage 2.275.O._10N.286.54.E11]|nr:hypothetical protein NVP2275O_153 [Vibrio phage 2.275.O._10N.286.54.E11]